MSRYYMFLKNNLIDFEKLIIDKYSFLGLDEIEVIILVKLNKLLNSGNKFSIEYFTKNMTITEDIIREKLVTLIKNWELTITGTRGFREAIITQGGVAVKGVNPSTMESKVIPGLYLAGEMLDIDALTGGFNLQLAWSTGHLAGISLE